MESLRFLGGHHTEDAKKRIGESSKVRWSDPEYRARVKAAMKGRIDGPEVREKRSIFMIGRKLSVETREKISFARRGKTLTESHRLAMKNCILPDDFGQRVSKGMLKAGITRSPETKAKMSIAKKKLWRTHLDNGSCSCGECRKFKTSSPTCIEVTLAKLLAEFPVVEQWKRFGRYEVDAYLPFPYHLAFEADGPWHDKDRDATRDIYLLEKFQLPVIRLTGKELQKMDRLLVGA